MLNHRLLYLSRKEVAQVGPSMLEIVDALKTAFKEKGEGKTEMPPKPSINLGTENNFMNAMLAYIPGLKSAGVKWVSAFPGNPKKGLPYISGLLILNDTENGLPIAVMDGVWITAKRTGAASALSALYLARRDSSVMGILGCGVQGISHAEAFNAFFPLKKIVAFDLNPEKAKSYAKEITKNFGINVVIATSPKQAVTDSDIVVTAGPILKVPHATIQPGWLKEGAFASLVDYDSYWHSEALKETSKLCVDDTPQVRLFQSKGYLQNVHEIHADLGELVCGQKSGRQNNMEKNMTINLGNALDDMAVAPLIFKNAVKKGIGTWLDL